MRRASIFVVLALAIVATARSQVAGDKPHEDSGSAEGRAGDFGALLLLSPEPDNFLKQWEQPARPGYVPQVTTTSKVRRGDNLAAFVVFHGCRVDDSGNCNATADFDVMRPDGSNYGSQPGVELWKSRPAPPSGHLQLGVGRLVIRIEPKDPLGKYTVKVVAHDQIAKLDVPVAAHFEVVAEEAEKAPRLLPTSIRTNEDLDVLLSDYYRQPDPDVIPSAISVLNREHILDHESSATPLLAFFTYIFAANKTRMPDWALVIDRQDEATKKLLRRAMDLSREPSQLFEGKAPSPELNDARWGAFAATGDTAHIAALIALLAHVQERKDMTLFLAAASAKWSLASQSHHHALVKTSLTTARSQVSPAVRQEIDDALNRDPAEIQDAMVEVLKAQHAAGAW